MIGYKKLFVDKDEKFDICIKFDTDTYQCDFYFRGYSEEFHSVNRFDKI